MSTSTGPGRTITQTDNTWFTLLTMNTHPLHFDEEYGRQSEFGRCIVASPFTVALMVGMSVTDVSQKAIANLGWTDIKLTHPVFAGDTLYAESEVLDKRESKSRPDAGIVTVRTRARTRPARWCAPSSAPSWCSGAATRSRTRRTIRRKPAMSRVSIKSKADLPQELWPLWEKMQGYGAFENQAGVMAHRPPIFRNTWTLLTELAEEGVLPKRYLELCLVTVSLLNKCTYCVSHHAPKLAVAGISEAGAAGLLDYKRHPELDEVDKLVVEYAIAVTNGWNRTRDEISSGSRSTSARRKSSS